MVHPAMEPRAESNGQWLPLIEYSVRSGISLSTIRRKIKSNSITYRVERGRYLILLEEGDPRPSFQSMPAPVATLPIPAKPTIVKSVPTEDNFERAVKMISDAFEHVVKEKDERIRALEQLNHEMGERLTELKTLVRVLEEKFGVRY